MCGDVVRDLCPESFMKMSATVTSPALKRANSMLEFDDDVVDESGSSSEEEEGDAGNEPVACV